MAKARPITGIQAQAATSKNARLIALMRLEELNQWSAYADEPQRVHELHNMRIAAKRLRYTLEVFEDVLPSASGALLEEMTLVQEELGAIHDTDVMIALVLYCLEPLESHKAISSKHHKQLNSRVARLKMQHEVTGRDEDGDKSEDKGGDKSESGKYEEATASPDLLAYLVDARGTLTDRERKGLENLMSILHRHRDEYFSVFQRHWHRLQEHDFSNAMLQQLEVV